jgi:hypothetical protein
MAEDLNPLQRMLSYQNMFFVGIPALMFFIILTYGVTKMLNNTLNLSGNIKLMSPFNSYVVMPFIVFNMIALSYHTMNALNEDSKDIMYAGVFGWVGAILTGLVMMNMRKPKKL